MDVVCELQCLLNDGQDISIEFIVGFYPLPLQIIQLVCKAYLADLRQGINHPLMHLGLVFIQYERIVGPDPCPSRKEDGVVASANDCSGFRLSIGTVLLIEPFRHHQEVLGLKQEGHLIVKNDVDVLGISD